MSPNTIQNEEKSTTGFNGDKSKFFYGYVITGVGFLLWLIGWGTFTPAFGVLLKPMLDDFGWSRAEASLGYSLATLGHGILAIPMGRLTDKFGPRIVVTVFGCFLGISYLLMSQVNALWQFHLNYALLCAIGLSTINVPVMATVARWFVKRRGLMMGIVQAGLGIGGLVSAPFVAWLTTIYGWRFSYVVLGIITLAGIIIPGLFLRGDPKDMGQSADGESEVPLARGEYKNEVLPGAGFSLREAVRTRRFWIIAGLYFSFGFCRSSFLPHTAAYVQDKGFSLSDGANVMAVLTVSSILGRIIMGRMADVIGNRFALIISEALTTVSLAVGLMSNHLAGLYFYGVVFGFGWGAQAVLRFSVTSEAFGLVSVGLVMGVLGLAEVVAASFGAYLAGYIFDIVGSYDPAFWLGIAVSVMGIILTGLKPSSTKSAK